MQQKKYIGLWAHIIKCFVYACVVYSGKKDGFTEYFSCVDMYSNMNFRYMFYILHTDINLIFMLKFHLWILLKLFKITYGYT